MDYALYGLISVFQDEATNADLRSSAVLNVVLRTRPPVVFPPVFPASSSQGTRIGRSLGKKNRANLRAGKHSGDLLTSPLPHARSLNSDPNKHNDNIRTIFFLQQVDWQRLLQKRRNPVPWRGSRLERAPGSGAEVDGTVDICGSQKPMVSWNQKEAREP